jgi:TonB-dependent receptor
MKLAQVTPPTTTPPTTVPGISVTVTGIRYSLEKSLETKRNSDSVIEVVTSDDIGKLPDKNIADAVQRVPGVTISSAAGGEGGFDENDRVSMRGTNPSLTQTLINGHSIASGDWFVLDQVQTVGRSVSFSLLPSELVSQVIVRKSATADLVEGGVAGAVDIITRRPLDFAKPLTFEASVQAVYADLPKKTDPQISALVNWKNDAGTAGIMIQAFSEKRHLRRDGQETLGYASIAPGSALATAHPDLANVQYPTLIGSSFFEQVRERQGGLVDVQRVLFAHEGDQLQPQLDVLRFACLQRRQRRDTDVVLGDQRHDHFGGVPEPGHADREAPVRDRRRDLPSRNVLRNGVLQPRRQVPRQRPAELHRPGRLHPRRRQDAEAGRVRGRRVQHRRDLSDARHLVGGRRGISKRQSV